MENLNAEQVKKALDWLDSLVGNSNDSDMAMFAYQLLGILYDTCEEKEQRIKELTEENERLKASVLEENHLRHQAEAMLANGMGVVKADTVRQMQERLKEHSRKMHSSDFSGEYWCKAVMVETIDQIAKEMLEGEK